MEVARVDFAVDRCGGEADEAVGLGAIEESAPTMWLASILSGRLRLALARSMSPLNVAPLISTPLKVRESRKGALVSTSTRNPPSSVRQGSSFDGAAAGQCLLKSATWPCSHRG